LPLTEGGIVIDIGTGDGRFVSAMARRHPDKFFIGVDANVKPLEKPSMRATRKPAKGGLTNALFVQAAVEDLPAEFDGVANEIHIHFPWGSLLGSVATGDEEILAGLRRIAAPDALLEIVVGIDITRDRIALERLGISELSDDYVEGELRSRYKAAGFEMSEHRILGEDEWRSFETSWARRLGSGGSGREVTLLVFRAS
jgi:16S rRNA (adenine(1408)-N(1))-methyltransferase